MVYSSTPMYRSKKRISINNRRRLTADLSEFLSKKKKVRCKALGRFVSLEKLPEVITNRYDAKRRLQAFMVAIDILQHSSSCIAMERRGKQCFELRGCDIEGCVVIVHLREETIHRNRILFFVSCATKKLPSTN